MGSIGAVKVPVVLQMEELDGGAACLGMVLGYHQKWVGLDQLRVACEISRDGIQPESIQRAAEGYGLDCRIESLSFEELREAQRLAIHNDVVEAVYELLPDDGNLLHLATDENGAYAIIPTTMVREL